jgi:sodium-dependent phosphate cotransporter
MQPRLETPLKILGVLALLYLFFVSIQLMGDSFKTWKAFSEALIQQSQNPFVGLFIGVLATSIIQSSSTTTAMTVGFVASGVLDVSLAVPIIMGANIGTSVTNTLVSMGHINRRAEFQRAMACATVHDIFNLLAVIALLPLELITRAIFKVGFLEWLAGGLARAFAGVGGFKVTSPLKMITKPVSHFIRDHILGGLFDSVTTIAVVGLILSAIMLFIALYFIVKLMRSMVLDKVEIFFDKYVGAHALIAMGMGLAITVMVQSSSITTSMLVPMAGAGILSLRQAFPITLGANVGTTITAMLASLAAANEEAQIAAVTIAFVHLLFNLGGILIFYPLDFIRRIPLRLAQRLAAACARRRWFAPVYVLTVFFIAPGLLIGLWRLVSNGASP